MLTSSCLAKKDKSPSVVSFTLSGAGKEIKIKCNHMHIVISWDKNYRIESK